MLELPTLVTAGLERAINQVLRLDPESLRELPRLAGKVIAVEVRGFEVGFYLVPEIDAIRVFSHFEGEPDTRLIGTPLGLARIGVSKDAGDVMFSGDVAIEGDVDYGRRFREFLGRLDIDWEEQLSKVTGDVIAHQVGNAVRGAGQWGEQARETLRRDAADYLHYELRLLPTRAEVDGFMQAVDELRSDLDRLAARVERLSQNRKPAAPRTDTNNNG